MKKKLLVIVSLATALFFTSCGSDTATTEASVKEGGEETKRVEIIKLDEVEGAFVTTELTLKEGEYKFEVTNKGVEHDVAFVLAPKKENIQEEDWIADAMLTNVIADGETSTSKGAVKLEKGEYVYFCPMNPTPQYTITVE